MHYLPILSTLVTFAFTVAVFNRFRYRHGAHLLLWSIGLLLYGMGTLTEVISLFTFSPIALKLWYLSGAMLTAAWLGQGTINLLVRRRGIAPTLNYILLVVSILAVVLVLLAPITPAAAAFKTSQPLSAQYKDILTRSGVVVLLTILLNTYGTLTLVGGAIYSAFIFWRKRILFNRMIGNILHRGRGNPACFGRLICPEGLARFSLPERIPGCHTDVHRIPAGYSGGAGKGFSNRACIPIARYKLLWGNSS